MNNLVTDIRKNCSALFENSTLNFRFLNPNRIVVTGNKLSNAVNNYGNGKRQVTVLYWFENFWIYIEISQSIRLKQYPLINISVSIFQGLDEDDRKNQLFRAEWDNWENNSSKHPQPHWHIYPFKYDNKVYEDFEFFNDMKEEESNTGFLAQINQPTKKLIDIRYIHFAMNEQWGIKQGCIQEIKDDKTIINWMYGLLDHIRDQLLFVL